MRTKLKSMIAILAMATLFTACKKGDIGPKGEKGDSGSANVTSVILNANTWAWDPTNKLRYASWSNVSMLTQNIVDNGAVMLYQKSGTSYIAWPISGNSGTTQEHDYFVYDLNLVMVVIENSDKSDPNPPAATFKLVCIPPAIIKSHPNVDWKNYSAANEVLNLD